jgi:hypothetical protein
MRRYSEIDLGMLLLRLGFAALLIAIVLFVAGPGRSSAGAPRSSESDRRR